MKRKKIYFAIFIVSVVGLFVVQYQYLRIGLNLAKVQFERKLENVGKDLKNDLTYNNQLTFLIAQALNGNDYFTLSKDSLQDASRYFLNDLIRDRLLTHKIKADFAYRLASGDDSLSLYSPVEFSEKDAIIVYPVELEGYLPHILKKDLSLELQFKNLNTYFLSQLNGLLIPGFIFLGIIIFVVIWMFRLYYWQRKIITITNNFINNLTHEFKTPVFSIGVATKLLEKDLDKDKIHILGHIRKQLTHLNKHIDQVLELANLESQSGFMELEETDLKPELSQLCEDFKMVAALEGFKFYFELRPGKYVGKIALSHFKNAISNLLDNAKKYSDNPEIELVTYTERNKLVLKIKDNGRGISNKELKQVFKKFYRVPEGNLYKVKGYGLGLSYVREVVKIHHGNIKIESELNSGTMVEITIPLKNEN